MSERDEDSKYRPRDLLVGTFVLAGIGVILVGVFTIRGMGMGGTKQYHALYANVGTLEVGSSVKYHGLIAGRVDALAISDQDPSRIRVDFTVRDDVPVTTESVAKITKADVLGDEFIELRDSGAEPGSAGAMRLRGEPLPPGRAVAAGEPFDLGLALERAQGIIETLHDVASSMQAQLDEVFLVVDEVTDSAQQLLSEDNRARIEDALGDLASTASSARQMVEDAAPRIEAIMGSAQEATATIQDTVSNVNASFDELRPELRELVSGVRAAVAEVETLAETLDTSAQSVDLQQVNDTVGNLEVATRNLVEFTHKVKDRPWLLIRKEKPQPAGGAP